MKSVFAAFAAMAFSWVALGNQGVSTEVSLIDTLNHSSHTLRGWKEDEVSCAIKGEAFEFFLGGLDDEARYHVHLVLDNKNNEILNLKVGASISFTLDRKSRGYLIVRDEYRAKWAAYLNTVRGEVTVSRKSQNVVEVSAKLNKVPWNPPANCAANETHARDIKIPEANPIRCQTDIKIWK